MRIIQKLKKKTCTFTKIKDNSDTLQILNVVFIKDNEYSCVAHTTSDYAQIYHFVDSDFQLSVIDKDTFEQKIKSMHKHFIACE